MSDEQEERDKRVAHYDSLLKIWVDSRMVLLKQLLTLSTLAIGLLVSVFATPSNIFELSTWFFAGISFLVCILCILLTLIQNTSHAMVALVRLTKKIDDVSDREEKINSCIKKLLITIAMSFIVGVTSTATLAVMRLDIYKIMGGF